MISHTNTLLSSVSNLVIGNHRRWILKNLTYSVHLLRPVSTSLKYKRYLFLEKRNVSAFYHYSSLSSVCESNHHKLVYCQRFFSYIKKNEIKSKPNNRTTIWQSTIEKNKVLQMNTNQDRNMDERKNARQQVEELIERENVVTIPNLLCVVRVMLSPYIGYTIVQGNFTLALGLLVVAGFTDLADGLIARNWPNQASRLGSFLDPMADKVLVGLLVASMNYVELLPLWLTAAILFRDIFLISAGIIIRYISLPPPKTLSRYFDVTYATAELAPTLVSKFNTAVQLATIATTLGAPIWNYIDHVYLHGLWYLTGATTVAAAVSYISNKNTYKMLKKNHKS